MSDIIIDGVNLNDLKTRYDALAIEQVEMRKSIAKGSAKFIADAVSEATNLIDEFIDDETVDGKEQAVAATKLLKDARFVSMVSGVQYYLPYYNSQGGYHPDGTPYSEQIDEDGTDRFDDDVFTQLYGVLEDMEGSVAEWNTSYC